MTNEEYQGNQKAVQSGAILSPEQQLRNVAAIVKQYATPARKQNGRSRLPSYSADKHTIAEASLQLAEMIEAYFDGDLAPVEDSEIPY